MALKFKFRKEKLITDANFYLFKEFTDIWEWDKNPGKPMAHSFFLFIFHLCDLSEDNPIRDVAEEKKEKEALFRTFGDKAHIFTEEEHALLGPAVACYIKHNRTAEERILTSFDLKAQETREVLNDTEPETVENSKDGVTTFVANTDIIARGLKELDSIKKSKINVISAVRKEAMMQRVRGQVTLSPLSKGNIAIVPESELYAQYETYIIQGEGDGEQEFHHTSSPQAASD